LRFGRVVGKSVQKMDVIIKEGKRDMRVKSGLEMNGEG
jgi:hypothetical protein